LPEWNQNQYFSVMKIVHHRITRSRIRKAGLSPFEASLLSRLAESSADLSTLVAIAEERGFENNLVSISLREHTATSLARLEQAALVMDDGEHYAITHKGSKLLKNLHHHDRLHEGPSPILASRLTVIVYLVSAGLALPAFFLTGSAELLAWSCLLLAWIGSFLLAWNGIRKKTEKIAARLIGFGILAFALGLLALGIMSFFTPFIVRRLLWVTLTLGLLGLSSLALLVIANIQSQIARKHASFSFAALAHAARRQALIGIMAIIACLASYVSLHFIVSFFLLFTGGWLLVSAARMIEALRKRPSASAALGHWFEHLARRSREPFFLAWLEQIISERGYRKSEILTIYRQNFVNQTTPFFDEINVNLSRDAWFEDHLDTLLGHLLYDDRAKIEDDRFVHKSNQALGKLSSK
jgi:hypothetical protein